VQDSPLTDNLSEAVLLNKHADHGGWSDPATTSSMSTEQQVYIHNDSDSEFESTQSLQLNPEVHYTFQTWRCCADNIAPSS
jgi:hypothetical protein